MIKLKKINMINQNKTQSFSSIINAKLLGIIFTALLIVFAGCTKDDDADDPIVNAESFLTVKVDGNLIESTNVIGGSLSDIMQFYAYENSDNPIFIFTIYNYKGIGEYEFGPDIVIRSNGDIFQGNESSTGQVKITYDNQLAETITLKGEFNGTLFSLLDNTQEVNYTEGEFQAVQE